MSSTNNTDSPVGALRAVPAPQPLTGLTGIPAAIYTELTAMPGEATVAELALAAGVSRSATGKALVTLEEHGLALRTRGGHEGARRVPDRWRAAPIADSGTSTPVTQDGDQDSAPAPAVESGHSAAPTPSTTALIGQKNRLAPGALRQLVIDHLTAHPDEAFTATKISRAIGKSSGAIANVLVKITADGVAEQRTERPRTYRLAAKPCGPR
ncbi:helix-turn-helix domain-containing protein [Streptomyces sp. N35]|uniref:helix-turn-helix domain-containing protein n=1 Tax=Streptomyces sp. N35 TaxID=2795730 RepID=UPI0018F6B20B|nr:helix-turn-helix domain-containing protein [Streptomyces sp. N35]